jgi:hypothetical protein
MLFRGIKVSDLFLKPKFINFEPTGSDKDLCNEPTKSPL